jgi:transposase
VKLPNEVVKTAASGAEESRRPTVVPASTAVDPELSTRPQRRRFTTQEKLRILAEVDRASQTGGIGSILRQEGLYWSILSRWREQRAAGMVNKGLTPAKRGPRAAKPSPEAVELAQLRREHARLQQRLDRAEAIIDLQKKLQSCWGCQQRSEFALKAAT